MKIAVMSDIHANIHALEAVLSDATEKGAEEFWNLGNSISFGAFHEEVISTLGNESIYSSIGSYDLMVMQSSSRAKKIRKKDIEKGRKIGFIKKHLSGSEKRFLESLPDRRNPIIEGYSVLAVHGSVEPLFASINEDSGIEELSEIFDILKKDAVICWLPGEPFIKDCGGKLFINPGSVGLPDDGDPHASYAIFEASESGISASLHRVDYDVEAAVFQASERGAPDIYAELLFSGRRKARGIRRAVHEDFIIAARSLATRNLWEEVHSLQIMRLSESIFNDLAELHGLGEKELILLQAAAILHDIGLRKGVRGHHKKSMQMILKSSLRPFSEKEKSLLALVARYHRKALPSKKHEIFSSLDAKDKNVVEILSSILRVSDGLDRTHRNMVGKISCAVNTETIEIICGFTHDDVSQEMEYGLKKSDLMKRVFGRDIVIKSLDIEEHGNSVNNGG